MEANLHKNKVHKTLSHSYLVYLIFFLFGFCLDLVFQIKIFTSSIMASFGMIILFLATILILWAQKSGRDFKKVKKNGEVKTEHFHRGPYRYTKIPTQYGLLFLIFGFGIITNSFLIVLSTLISFIVSKFIFMTKNERILIEKYGNSYLEYKKLVKF